MAHEYKETKDTSTLENDKLDRNDDNKDGWPVEWAGTTINQTYTKNQG